MAGCTTCGSLVDGAGMCTNPTCRAFGGNDGILNNERKSSKNDSCWVATAYYENSQNPNVEALREMRTYFLNKPKTSWLTKETNRLYHKIGRTKFGAWWARHAGLKNRYFLVRATSKVLLAPALYMAKKVKAKTER